MNKILCTFVANEDASQKMGIVVAYVPHKGDFVDFDLPVFGRNNWIVDKVVHLFNAVGGKQDILVFLKPE